MQDDVCTGGSERLSDRQFQTLMDLTMVSDPWPLDYGNEEITELLHAEARSRGFDGWYVAYHEFDKRPKTSIQVDVSEYENLDELKLYPDDELVVIDFGKKKVQYQDVPESVQNELRDSYDKSQFYVERIRGEYRYIVLRYA